MIGLYKGVVGNPFHQQVVLTALGIPYRLLGDQDFLNPRFASGLRLVIFPAGYAIYAGRNVLGGPVGEQNLRQAVRDGLNYYGVCAGAVMGLSGSADADAVCLRLCDATEPYGAGTQNGFLHVCLTASWLDDLPDMDLWYHNGPLFRPNRRGTLAYRVLAEFRPEVGQHPPVSLVR